MREPSESFDVEAVFQIPWSVMMALRRGSDRAPDVQLESQRLLGNGRALPKRKSPGGLSILAVRLTEKKGA